MIKTFKVTDNNNAPLDYIKDLEAFNNGKEYNFKNGINIIIGKNGCGKSTLIKLLTYYMLCSEKLYSKLPNFKEFGAALALESMFQDEKLKDGIEIEADYCGVVYNYLTHNNMKGNEILNSIHNMNLYYNNNTASTGESTLNYLEYLFNFSFKNRDVQFPLDKIFEESKETNDFWKKRLDNLLNYYKNHSFEVSRETFEYTFLIDEPDRNLDIDNIQTIYNILSFKKKMTQLICVIHNPILIYKLSKLDYINFIELSDNYLNKIKEVFKDI